MARRLALSLRARAARGLAVPEWASKIWRHIGSVRSALGSDGLVQGGLETFASGVHGTSAASHGDFLNASVGLLSRVRGGLRIPTRLASSLWPLPERNSITSCQGRCFTSPILCRTMLEFSFQFLVSTLPAGRFMFGRCQLALVVVLHGLHVDFQLPDLGGPALSERALRGSVLRLPLGGGRVGGGLAAGLRSRWHLPLLGGKSLRGRGYGGKRLTGGDGGCAT